MKEKYAKLKEQVKTVLTNVPLTRDSDEALLAQLLKLMGFNTAEMTVQRLLQGMHNKTCPNWESVGRYRRMCQKEFPELQGTKYEERHAEQASVLDDLGYKYTQLGEPGTLP